MNASRPPTTSPRNKLSDKINLAQLAQIGGVSTAFMRRFVQETIAIIEAGLLRDGIVKIHQFGTFRLVNSQSTIPQVIFQPAKNVREMVLQAYGPSVHTGSQVSLSALLEKHLHWAAPQIRENTTTPVVEQTTSAEPVYEKFDINDFIPNLPEEAPPRLTFAETAVEDNVLAPAPVEVETIPAQPPQTNGKSSNSQAPTFTFADSAEKLSPVFSPAFLEPKPLPPQPVVPVRKRPLIWYAGAIAALVLLLLFLLPGRLGEKPKPLTNGVTAEATKVVALARDTSKPQNGEASVTATKKVTTQVSPFYAGGIHRVIPEDNLWKISNHYYRNPYLWPNIYRANLDSIPNPNVLERDQQLALPILYGPPEQLTVVDRRHLAEGYFLLYRHYRTHEPALAPFALWAAVRYDAQIRANYAAELRADDWAFLQAHGVTTQVAER